MIGLAFEIALNTAPVVYYFYYLKCYQDEIDSQREQITDIVNKVELKWARDEAEMQKREYQNRKLVLNVRRRSRNKLRAIRN